MQKMSSSERELEQETELEDATIPVLRKLPIWKRSSNHYGRKSPATFRRPYSSNCGIWCLNIRRLSLWVSGTWATPTCYSTRSRRERRLQYGRHYEDNRCYNCRL